jgi:DNA-binding LacI/PurR family transcriptional regulator
MPRTRSPADVASGRATLRTLAAYLDLSPASISLVLNRAPAAAAIPRVTQERIRDAARRFDYRPNSLARSLRGRPSLTIGVIVPEISEGYSSLVMSGIEDCLLQEGYLYFIASHRHRADLIDEYPKLLLERSVDGIILIDTPWRRSVPVPVVAVSGHHHARGVSNIVLNHTQAAFDALKHLQSLGHRSIAFIKGQSFSSDTAIRWKAIRRAAADLGISVSPELVVQLDGDLPSPDLGYQVTRRLLAGSAEFTALFAFNDISAIGAIGAIRDVGLRVPDDVSVLGFDDIQSSAYQNPALSTVRQPLQRMGELAAQTLLRRIRAADSKPYPRQIVEKAELVVRGSTACAPLHQRRRPRAASPSG